MKIIEKCGRDTLLGILVGGCIIGLCFLVLPKFHNKKNIQAGQLVVAFEPGIIKLGKVFQAETVHREFKLVNHGTNSIRVLSARTSCMCTVIGGEIGSAVIPPKGSINVPVEFHTGSVNGFVNAKVEALLEANGSRYYAIGVLEGDVLGDFDFQPRMLDFGTVELGQTATRTVKITAGACKDLVIKLPESSERLQLALTTNKLLSGVNSYELKATFHAPVEGASQPFSGSVDVVTSSERVPLLKIPIFAMARAEAEIEPSLVVFAQTGSNDELRFKINSLRPSRILRVVAKNGTASEVVSTLNAATDSEGTWSLTHNQRLESLAIKKSDRIDFELEVQNGRESVEARILSVQIKSL